MKLILALLLASTGLQAAPRQYTIEQLMKSARIGGFSFSPDEKQVYFHSNQTGIFNVFAAPSAGGPAKQITKSTKESIFLVSAFPKDGRILYSHDAGGDENSHLFVREPNGKDRELTPGAKVKAIFLGWSADDKGFWFGTNERDAKAFDVYRMDAATLQRTLVFQSDPLLPVADISDDGRYLALEKKNGTIDSDVYLYDTKEKKQTHLTPHQGDVTYEFAGFDNPATGLYLISNAGREFKALERIELASGRHEPIRSPDWDVMYASISRHGKYRATATNEEARTRIKILEIATKAEVRLPDLGAGDIASVHFSNSEKKLAFYLSSDREPSDLYVLDLPTGKVSRITRAMPPEVSASDLVDGQDARFKSFDGMTIPNVLFKPQQASAAQKAPALVWVHGGPGGQTRHGYSPFLQYLVNHGYVVLGINNRGSSGYGKTFFTADDQKHGKEPLQDCVQAKKFLQQQDYVDPTRIGIIGGSYGGYMTLAALAFQPEVFDAGVDIFGVSNWVRTLESIPPYWEAARKSLYQEIGDPATQKEMLREISPLFHADKIKRPLLVLQGANDPRVIKPESDEIVEAVKKNGVPVQYVVFPDEGHGFRKRENEIKAYGTVLQFLDAQLRKHDAAAPAPN